MRRLIALDDDDDHAEGAGNNRWMISYADFITLLFVLFLALYAKLPKLTENGTQVPHGEQAQTARDTRAPAAHVETVAQTFAPPPAQPRAPESTAGEKQIPVIVPASPAPGSAPVTASTSAPKEPDARTQAMARNPVYGTDEPRPVYQEPAQPTAQSTAEAQAVQRAAQSQQAAQVASNAQAPQAAPAKTAASASASSSTSAAAPNASPAASSTTAQSVRSKLTESFAGQVASGTVTLGQRNDGVVMDFADSSFFAPGTAQLTPQAQQILDKVAATVSKTGNAVIVEGHTDNQPVKGSLYPSNWELSSARAAAVARGLAERGISPERLTASGLANTRPRASNDNEAGRSQNRRVSVIVLGAAN
jgi:chemotaxis protein MotB